MYHINIKIKSTNKYIFAKYNAQNQPKLNQTTHPDANIHRLVALFSSANIDIFQAQI
ncbi:MAG: hypothetical protein Q8S84_06620 [bacterium]|nr:hypothetical protein [bacterium]MDP3381135.1 hypothetical protein [bacterium]